MQAYCKKEKKKTLDGVEAISQSRCVPRMCDKLDQQKNKGGQATTSSKNLGPQKDAALEISAL